MAPKQPPAAALPLPAPGSPITSWLPVFSQYLDHVLIPSKEMERLDPHDPGVPIKPLWGSQSLYMTELAEGLDRGVRTFFFLKNRQAGISTISLALDLFWLAWYPGTQGVLVADTEGNLRKFRFTLKRILAAFPKHFFGQAFSIEKGADNRDLMGFTNGSSLDLLVAGKARGANRNKTLGESRGYNFAHLSECANFGSPEGLQSFRETLAEHHPNRLYIYESTAKGFNHWHAMYEEGVRDRVTKKSIFIGWWAKEINSLRRNGPPDEARNYHIYGTQPPSPEEREKMKIVLERHKHVVTSEQLAWYRARQADTSLADDDLKQNQPWYAEEAFVLTGASFFQVRLVQKHLAHLYQNPDVEGYAGYKFHLANNFLHCKMEQVLTDRSQVQLRVWEEPSPRGTYVIGVDPAWGRGEQRDAHCLHPDTEILTRYGWKTYDQLKLDDLAVCFDLETGTYKYGPIREVIVKNYKGPMHHFTSDGLDCFVTPEHRVVYRSGMRFGRSLRWNVTTADKLYGAKVIPKGGAPLGPGIPGLSLDMCRALGWIITDGHCSRTSKNPAAVGTTGKRIRHRIILAQGYNTEKNCLVYQEIDKVLGRLCKHTRRDHISRPGQRAAQWMIGAEESEKFLYWLDASDIHKIPRTLLNECSPEQAEALFQGLLEGDGRWDKKHRKFTSFCPGQATELADGFQELALKLGHSTSRLIQKGGLKNGKRYRDQWIVSLSQRQAHTVMKKEVVDYEGPVWCVNVPTGAFVARRNGKAFVTGNCLVVYRCYADCVVQVAEYTSKAVDTRQAAWVLAYLAGAYRDCVLNIEVSGGGGLAILSEFKSLRMQLQTSAFPETRRDTQWEDFLAQARWFIYRRYDVTSGASNVTQWSTTRQNKFEILNQLRDTMAKNELQVRSIPLLEEMTYMVQAEGSIEASGRNKDDRVMASAFAIRAWIDAVRPGMLQSMVTYSAVHAAEMQTDPPVLANMANTLVKEFFKNAEANAQVGPQPPKWMVDRGLV